MIWWCAQNHLLTSQKQPMKTAMPTTASRRVSGWNERLGDRLGLRDEGRFLGRPRREERERDEREEPGQIEVEPVRQHELEADQQCRAECGDSERGPASWPAAEHEA